MIKIPKRIKLMDVLKGNLDSYSDIDYKYTLYKFKLNTKGTLKEQKKRLRKFSRMLARYCKKSSLLNKILQIKA